MVRCMLADSGSPTFRSEELMFTAAHLANRALHSAPGVQSLHEIRNQTYDIFELSEPGVSYITSGEPKT